MWNHKKTKINHRHILASVNGIIFIYFLKFYINEK